MVFERNMHLLTSRIAIARSGRFVPEKVICSEFSFRKVCPRKLAHTPGHSQRALDLGRVLSLLTVRPLEYYSSQICIAALRLNQYKIVMPQVLYFLIVDSVIFAACLVKNYFPSHCLTLHDNCKLCCCECKLHSTVVRCTETKNPYST